MTAEAGDAPSTRSGLVTARRVLVWLVAGLLAILALTGAYLAVAYQPSPSVTLLAFGSDGWPPTGVTIARTVHRWSSQAILGVALGLAAVAAAEAVVRWRGSDRRRRGVALGPTVLVAALVAAVSGPLLAYDQIALWAVTVGANLAGYRTLFDDRARFFIVHGSEVSVGAMTTVMVVHVSLGLVLALVLVGLRERRARPAEATEPGPTPTRPAPAGPTPPAPG